MRPPATPPDGWTTYETHGVMVDPDTEPVTYHTPAPWQNDVKAGLDQDGRLGILEPVHIGEPVTWCHRMVVCTKKLVSLAEQ